MWRDGRLFEDPPSAPPSSDQRRFNSTHELDGSVRIGSFDALSLWDTGLEGRIITSPNMNFIPEFPTIEHEGLFIREDGTWGPHDYTRWPQAYSSQNLHHVCIPRLPAMGTLLDKNEHSADYEPIAFSDLGEDMWEKTGEHKLYCSGTVTSGQYRRAVIDGLVRSFYLYKQKAISRYTTTEFKDASDPRLIAVLSNVGEKVIERLKKVSEPFYGSRSTARELQRVILELLGFINLLTDVRPRLRNPTFTATGTLPYRGAFCSSAQYVQDLFRVGIPVWYIRHVSSLSPSIKVINVVDPLPLCSCIVTERARIRGRPVHIGDLQVNPDDLRSPHSQIMPDLAMSELLASMRIQSRMEEPTPLRIMFPLPSHPSPAPMTMPQQPKLIKRRQSDVETVVRPTKRARNNDDDKGSQAHAPSGSLLFFIPDGLYPGQRDLPPISRSWMKAVTKVGLYTKRRPSETAKYHYPPPFLFSHPNPDRLACYYHNYVRIERFLRERLMEGSLFGKQSYSIKQWRDILYGDYFQSGDIDNKVATSMIRTLDASLPSGRSAQVDSNVNSRGHDRKKRGKRAEIRVTLGVQGQFPPYSPDVAAKWWFTGENVTLEDVKANRHLRKTILFDVHGTGFILDLWTMDYRLLPRTSLTPDAVRQRHLLLASVYNGVVGESDYKISASGMKHLWSDKPDVRALESFVRIVRDWPDCPKKLLDVDVSHCEGVESDAIYEQLTGFFVSKCTDVLDRLPVVPCYLLN